LRLLRLLLQLELELRLLLLRRQLELVLLRLLLVLVLLVLLVLLRLLVLLVLLVLLRLLLLVRLLLLELQLLLLVLLLQLLVLELLRLELELLRLLLVLVLLRSLPLRVWNHSLALSLRCVQRAQKRSEVDLVCLQFRLRQSRPRASSRRRRRSVFFCAPLLFALARPFLLPLRFCSHVRRRRQSQSRRHLLFAHSHGCGSVVPFLRKKVLTAAPWLLLPLRLVVRRQPLPLFG
jgi:hypothetical protein